MVTKCKTISKAIEWPASVTHPDKILRDLDFADDIGVTG